MFKSNPKGLKEKHTYWINDTTAEKETISSGFETVTWLCIPSGIYSKDEKNHQIKTKTKICFW